MNDDQLPPDHRIPAFAAWLCSGLLRLVERMQAYSLELPWTADVRWPDCCMVCGAESPRRVWFEHVGRPGLWSALAGVEPPWRKRRLDVPLCASCHSRCRCRAWLRRLVPVALLLAVLLGGLWLAGHLVPIAPVAARVVRIGSVLGSISLAIVVALTLGFPIDVTGRKSGIHFEFKRRELAEALARANGVEVRESELIP